MCILSFDAPEVHVLGACHEPYRTHSSGTLMPKTTLMEEKQFFCAVGSFASSVRLICRVYNELTAP